MKMRRKERAVTDMNEIKTFLDEEKVARLGMNDDGQVYIVPLNYGYENPEGNKLVFYFHCGLLGRKLAVLEKNPNVCIEIDGRHGLMNGEMACSHSYYYASLIGNGKIEFVKDMDEKMHGLSVLMDDMTGKADWEFTEKWMNAIHILKLEIEDYTVKQNKPAM